MTHHRSDQTTVLPTLRVLSLAFDLTVPEDIEENGQLLAYAEDDLGPRRLHDELREHRRVTLTWLDVWYVEQSRGNQMTGTYRARTPEGERWLARAMCGATPSGQTGLEPATRASSGCAP
jgi:spore germination protein YaaH